MSYAAPSAPTVLIDRIQVVRLSAGTTFLDGAGTEQPSFDIVHVLAGDVRLTAEPAQLQTGDIAILCSSGRVRIDLALDAELVVVRIPEDISGAHAQAIRAAVGRTLRAEHGTTGLVAHLLRGLAAHGDSRTEHPVRLAQHVVGLIGLMCLDSSDDDSWRSDLFRAAVDHIESRLSDVDLAPDGIAAAQNISTRTLHRLFEREGVTLGAWIRTRRLEQCRAELVDPIHSGTSVSAIGARWGLWDAAHFSRLFKAAYGASPRAYRQQALDERGTANQARQTA